MCLIHVCVLYDADFLIFWNVILSLTMFRMETVPLSVRRYLKLSSDQFDRCFRVIFTHIFKVPLKGLCLCIFIRVFVFKFRCLQP